MEQKEEIVMQCPFCSTINRNDAKSCFSCGTPFPTKEETAPMTTAVFDGGGNNFNSVEYNPPVEEVKKSKKEVRLSATEEKERQEKEVSRLKILEAYKDAVNRMIYEFNRNFEFAAGGVDEAYQVKDEETNAWIEWFLWGDKEVAKKNGLDVDNLPEEPEEKLVVFQEVEKHAIPAALGFVNKRIKRLEAEIQERDRVHAGERSVPVVTK